ncbi:hypothetical protein T09_13283 [Trichinella sp. T9]|nr:hypothetical protein T09_13283 [Trichinella sp. T9]
MPFTNHNNHNFILDFLTVFSEVEEGHILPPLVYFSITEDNNVCIN